MNIEIVLTAIGHDRPGLVETLAEAVTNYGGNWVESSMSRLGGEFAGIVRVLIAEENLPALQAELSKLDQNEDIAISFRHDSTDKEQPKGQKASFELLGHDQRGIVLKVTQILARHQVNVTELETSVTASSMEGAPMFKARAELLLPSSLDISELEAALEEIASDIMVDIDLKTA